ncbi:hypothetical protein BDP81DRAFT_397049 [Colletotrichum phormii]|uniref:Uncharacterized protein n=1 Tax=Colletotrichum phormii TaxID=359342 RepID=A0AAI9ZL50_9PEZI|nr:uncharacterized protein BDP81DRAFT_397049 [Colletotrichum phormii]KAK1633696.1 hypothetical protein BDP81DRAFT_397049 [Colletotrichum phormii]
MASQTKNVKKLAMASQPQVLSIEKHVLPFSKPFKDWRPSPLPSIRLPAPSESSKRQSIVFATFSGVSTRSCVVDFELSPDGPLDASMIPNGYAVFEVIGGSPKKKQRFQVHKQTVYNASAHWAWNFDEFPNQRIWPINERPTLIRDLMSILHAGFLPRGSRRSCQDILALCYLARVYLIMGSVRRVLDALLHASTAMTNQELWYMVLAAQPLCCDNQRIGELAYNILVWRQEGSFYPLREFQFLDGGHMFHYEESEIIANMDELRHSLTLQLCEVAVVVDKKLLRNMFLGSNKDRPLWDKLTYLQHFVYLKFPKLPLGSEEWSYEAVLTQESLEMAVVRDDDPGLRLLALCSKDLWALLRDIWPHIAKISNEYVLGATSCVKFPLPRELHLDHHCP